MSEQRRTTEIEKIHCPEMIRFGCATSEFISISGSCGLSSLHCERSRISDGFCCWLRNEILHVLVVQQLQVANSSAA
jgi:hypothetical protein